MTGKRRRKSSISQLPQEQREHIERLLRGGQHTLDQMIDELRARWPGEPAAEVSRSALHRYDQHFAVLTERMRRTQQMADALVGELGEGIGEKSGALLTQAVMTLATDVALKAHGDEDTSIDEVRKLAVAAKNALDSQRLDINARKAIREEARAQLLREQSEALDKVVKTGGLSEDRAREFREKILGVRPQ